MVLRYILCESILLNELIGNGTLFFCCTDPPVQNKLGRLPGALPLAGLYNPSGVKKYKGRRAAYSNLGEAALLRMVARAKLTWHTNPDAMEDGQYRPMHNL